MTTPYEGGSVARAYQLVSAGAAGELMGQFANEEAANNFYEHTGGPLPFAKTLYGDDDEAMVRCIVGIFLLSLKKTGFTIWSANKVA